MRAIWESHPPVKQVAHISRGPEIQPPILVEITPELLNWRKIVCASSLKGFLREIAAGSELESLTDNIVVLRVPSLAMVNEGNRLEIQTALSAALGHPFEVRFSPMERTDGVTTLSKIEESERRAARAAMIEAFQSDPFVQQYLNMFNATLDITTVRKLN